MRLVAILLALTAAAAQAPSVRQARLTGGDPGRGKCTAEVSVDGVAEIEIGGAQGRLRTLSGPAAAWKTLECTTPLPPNAPAFVFAPQAGRGDQYLIREPRENGGAALIRVEDSRGGPAAYSFTLEWRDAKALLADGGFEGAGLSGGILNPAGAGARTAWDGDIDVRAAGDGYYHSFSGNDALLKEGVLRVQRDGLVHLDFATNQRYRLQLSGRLVHAARNRLVAAMSGAGITGTMEILLDGRDRVRELSMSGSARNRFELRWRAK